MSVLTVDDLRVEPDAEALASAGISQPAERRGVSEPSFVVRGWALGSAARALAVEMRADGRLVRVAAVREATPDIAAALPDRAGAERCGFLTRVHVDALQGASELRLEAVLANGARAAIGAIALGLAESPERRRGGAPERPSIRADVEQLVRAEADRHGVAHEAAFERPAFEALDGVELEGRTVLDLSGGPGHVARAARARGAALVDSVHLDDDLADLARLLDLYHRVTRVFVHDSVDALDRRYDVVLMLGAAPTLAPEALDALTSGTVVRP